MLVLEKFQSMWKMKLKKEKMSLRSFLLKKIEKKAIKGKDDIVFICDNQVLKLEDCYQTMITSPYPLIFCKKGLTSISVTSKVWFPFESFKKCNKFASWFVMMSSFLCFGKWSQRFMWRATNIHFKKNCTLDLKKKWK